MAKKKKDEIPKNVFINEKVLGKMKELSETLGLSHETVIESVVVEFIVNHK